MVIKAKVIRICTAALILFSGVGLVAQTEVQIIQASKNPQRLTVAGKITWRYSTSAVDPVIESQEFLKTAAGQLIENPNAKWIPIVVPEKLESQMDERPAQYWVRKVFILKDLSDSQISLDLGRINDRDRTYLNGVLIGSTGDWDAIAPQSYDRRRIYPVPDKLINRNGPNILLIQVHRYFEDASGIERDHPVIGTSRAILDDYYIPMWIRGVALAAYPPLGIFFLIIYAVRRTHREYLYFGIFSILLTLYQFYTLNIKYETGLDFLTLKRSEYILLYLMFPSFTAFVENYFGTERIVGGKWLRYFVRALNVYIVAHALFVLFTNNVNTWWVVQGTWVQPIWIPIILYFAIVMLQRAFQGRKDAVLLLPATIVLMLSVALDTFTARGDINLPVIVPYAFSFFIFSIAFLLGLRFAESLGAVEKAAQELESTNTAYSRFVPMEFLHFLDRKAITEVRLGDQTRREMTILFSDIRSFTEISETMSPEDNFNFLNSYLRRMQPHVQAHRGFIDKYIGDAIMALFPDRPSSAVDAAIAMQIEITSFNKNRAERGYAGIRAGIGLHSGWLMLGTIGAAARMEGTVISDAVNLAARMEGLTKYYGAGILITEHVLMGLEDPSRYRLRALERVRVKGKSESVSVIEVLDGRPDLELCIQTLGDFDKAIHAYLSREWNLAIELFSSIVSKNPNDHAAALMVKRASENLKRGVAEDWEGIIDMDSK